MTISIIDLSTNLRRFNICVVVFVGLLLSITVTAQNQTVGLMVNKSEADDGYTLLAKNGTTYLIDRAGLVVHTWTTNTMSTHPGYLQDNGDLMLVNRGVRRISWDGDLVWRYNNPAAHHDAEMLPNGHVLLLIYGEKTTEQAIAAGRDAALVTSDGLEPMEIYEVTPTGQIVWQWQVWDHLIQDLDASKDNFGVVADHPELVDINFTRNTSVDWLHGNAIDYNQELDQILVSPRFNSEIWIIDHSTSSTEAAGHSGGLAGQGGDLLFRWGNPIAYARGLDENQQLFGSHDAQWIEAGLQGEGNILVFNNGGFNYSRDGDYSTIDEIMPQLNNYNYGFTADQVFAPESQLWIYQDLPRENFYSSFISGVQRLPNGNTLINEGENGRIFEVTSTGETVWQFQNPIINTGLLMQGDTVPAAPQPSLFRVYKYPLNHPAFTDKQLVPNGTIEQYASIVTVTIQSSVPELVNYPGEGIFSLGEGQLMILSAQESPTDQFQNWTVLSGKAVINEPNQANTTFTATAENTIIQANYTVRTEFIFADGFE